MSITVTDSPPVSFTTSKEAVEAAFGVSVVNVNTMHVRGKSKRFGPKVSQLKSWKKAIVTLDQSDSITLFEGV